MYARRVSLQIQQVNQNAFLVRLDNFKAIKEKQTVQSVPQAGLKAQVVQVLVKNAHMDSFKIMMDNPHVQNAQVVSTLMW
jgi:ribosomal protein S8